jgi:hypothetical protein
LFSGSVFLRDKEEKAKIVVDKILRKYLLREVFLLKLKLLRKSIVYIQEKFKNCRKNREARIFIVRINFMKEFKFLLKYYRYKALFNYNT